MRFLKKHISILILMSLASMPVFFSVYFCFEKMAIEYKMEVAMEYENLQELTLLTKEIIWLKKDKEILVGNEMFDIKSLKKKGAFTIVKGLYDYKEKELKKKFLLATSRESNDGKENQYLKIIFTCLYINSNSSFTGLAYFLKKSQYAAYINIMPYDNFMVIPSPPPKGFHKY